ncbi:hypothetical protein [Planococcus sp. SSTMD024]|uniref:hypothetical protein n=1 Tax=Planococcus sp. SSTMD024 TaxID=3242163 RepID=UPI00351EE662
MTMKGSMTASSHSLVRLHPTRFSLAETFMAIYRHFKGLRRQKFTKEFKKIGFGVFGTNAP